MKCRHFLPVILLCGGYWLFEFVDELVHALSWAYGPGGGMSTLAGLARWDFLLYQAFEAWEDAYYMLVAFLLGCLGTVGLWIVDRVGTEPEARDSSQAG